MCYFTCMYCPKLVIHSNQIKLPMASSVDYIISQCPCPSAKFCPCVLVHKMSKIFILNSSLELISHHLLAKSIPLRYVNIIMTESIRPLWEIMLMFFKFLKSLGYMCNLCCQNETSNNKVWPITLIFRMNISGLFLCYLSCVIDEQDRYWKLSNGNQILALLIETQWDTRH